MLFKVGPANLSPNYIANLITNKSSQKNRYN